jgi:hypothetical protein
MMDTFDALTRTYPVGVGLGKCAECEADFGAIGFYTGDLIQCPNCDAPVELEDEYLARLTREDLVVEGFDKIQIDMLIDE